MYVRNAWYMAGWNRDFETGKPVVLKKLLRLEMAPTGHPESSIETLREVSHAG